MKEDLSKLIELYGTEISTDLSPDVYDYVLLNLKRIKNHRLKFDIPVIGIAGKHGKTITKRMLTSVLSEKGKILETPLFSRTATNVTSTLIKLNENYDYVLLEFGIQHEQQFKLAAEIAQPNLVVFTNIGETNYAYLGDRVLVSEIKAELIKNLPPDGVAVLNFDDDLCNMLEKYAQTPNVIKFGLNPNSHFHASDLKYLGPEGIKFKLNSLFDVHLPVFSISEIYNALAAIATTRGLGIDIEESLSLLEKNFVIPPGRGNLVEANNFRILDFSYDASPDTVSKAARALIDFKKYSSNLIMIIGEMGDFQDKNEFYYSNVGFYLGALPIDVFITIGRKAKIIADGIKKVNATKKEIYSFIGNDLEGISQVVNQFKKPDSTVLITGSYQQELHTTVQHLANM